MSDKNDKYVIQVFVPRDCTVYYLHPAEDCPGEYVVNAGLVGCGIWTKVNGTAMIDYLKASFNNLKLVPFLEALEQSK